jgi:hypothetical protein
MFYFIVGSVVCRYSDPCADPAQPDQSLSATVTSQAVVLPITYGQVMQPFSLASVGPRTWSLILFLVICTYLLYNLCKFSFKTTRNLLIKYSD